MVLEISESAFSLQILAGTIEGKEAAKKEKNLSIFYAGFCAPPQNAANSDLMPQGDAA